MDQLSPLVAQNKKPEQQFQAGGGNDEEVDRGDAVCVIPQERRPRLRGRTPITDPVSGDRRLHHIDPELQKLSVNPRCAP